MKNFFTSLVAGVAVILICLSCAKTEERSSFKVIGYILNDHVDTVRNNYDQLTHINYSFAIPSADSGHVLLKDSTHLRMLVRKAHQKGKKVFLSIGGWWVGDEPGDDRRFHRMAEKQEFRNTFVNESLSLAREFHLDGIDVDWEYPDAENRSYQDYILLMRQLADSLHARDLQISAAVVSHGPHGAGIAPEIFEIVDWLNLMAYDDDDGKWVPHSPYSLAEETINYWVAERKLPASKAVLGLPFYGKPWHRISDYKDLIRAGADPNSDQFDSVFFNGVKTIQNKTSLALQRKLAGVMIWEISQDTIGEHSLLKTIETAVTSK
jgi:GH18 family chitinase